MIPIIPTDNNLTEIDGLNVKIRPETKRTKTMQNRKNAKATASTNA
jgi:hypothetical protein